MKRLLLTVGLYSAFVLAFFTVLGSGSLLGCGNADDGAITPDVAARLETRARDAARAADQAIQEAGATAGQLVEQAADRMGAESALDETALDPTVGDTATDPAVGDAATDPAVGDTAPGVGAGPLPAAQQPGAADCFELLDEGAYAEALSACTAALAADPDDAKLQEAVAAARRQAAQAPVDAAEAVSLPQAEAQDALGSLR